MSVTRVMLSGSERLNGIIAELLDGGLEFEVIASERGVRGLARKAESLTPDLIIVNIKPIGCGVRRTVEAIRKSNPKSRIVVICPGRDLMDEARNSGADGYVEQERILVRLLPAVMSTMAPNGLVKSGVMPKACAAGWWSENT